MIIVAIVSVALVMLNGSWLFPTGVLDWILFLSLFWIVAVLYAANFIAGREDYDYEKYDYTQLLNGGIRYFQTKKYIVRICERKINNNHFFGDSTDAVELTIKDEQGQLLAKRHYEVFWDGQPGHGPLRTGPGSILYQDDDKQVEHTIAMPPTAIEWIRARIFLLN